MSFSQIKIHLTLNLDIESIQNEDSIENIGFIKLFVLLPFRVISNYVSNLNIKREK